MAIGTVFFHGGGDYPDTRASTFGRFARAALSDGRGVLALVVVDTFPTSAENRFTEYRAIFKSVGAPSERLIALYVTPDSPLKRDTLDTMQPTGVFVCGGITPLYHQAVCADSGWLDCLRERDIPCGGTSVGAVIAARQAILGGWQAKRHRQARPMLYEGANERLDVLTVQAGLGVVPFAIDTHASQMGTLVRLIHCVQLGLVEQGWGIDEETQLEVRNGQVTVYGKGHSYLVQRRADGAASVETFVAAG